MKLPTTTLFYGIALNGEEINAIKKKLSENLTLTQKKALYICLGLVDQVDYDNLDVYYKKAWDELDTDEPEFMVTDFGWCEISDFYDLLQSAYPALEFQTYEEKVAGVQAAGTMQNVEYAETFDINTLTSISDEAKSQLAQFMQDYDIHRNPGYTALTR